MRQIQLRAAVRHVLARHSIALFVSAVTSSIAFAQQPPTPPARQGSPRPAASAPVQQRQAAPPVGRQGPRGSGASHGRDGQSGPGRGAAGMLIAMKAQLELTDDQVRKLEALRDGPHPSRNESELLRARADMMDAMQGDGDLTKARAAMDKMSRLHNDDQIARLKERQDVRNVLTAAQKTTFDNMRGMMRHRMHSGMKSGMKRRMKMEGQGFAPSGRRGRMGALGGGMGPGMGPGMMGPGMGPGVGPGDTGPNGLGSMQPAMGRRGQSNEPDVNDDKRPPVPPSDSLSIR